MKDLLNEMSTNLSSNRPFVKPLSNRARLKLAGISIVTFTLLFSFLLIALSYFQKKSSLGVVLTYPQKAETPFLPMVIREFPDTKENIHVFNDQLATWNMGESLFEFSATHYAGTQKVFASDARRLRSHNPKFVVLNYRLGLGLGYQNIAEECKPDGSWIEIIEGERWIHEYPENLQDEWFYKLNGQHVLFCEWGWYLMDIGNTSWRDYWTGEVLRQLRTNNADGVFVDSLFPPNYLGGNRFNPELPAKDQAFENTWSSKIENFISMGQSGDMAAYYFITNVGQWLTGRDITDYSGTDGIMVEGFGRWTDGGYFSVQDEDWQLQMDRILGMVNMDKIVILQQYVKEEDKRDRMFLLGNYLLTKGHHTYINLEFSTQPEWFPEYEIPIGTPVGGIPASISSLWRPDWQIYAREYSNGLVLVNPSDKVKNVELGRTYFQAIPFGGGIVPHDGDISDWTIEYKEVTRVSLDPNQAEILLDKMPVQ